MKKIDDITCDGSDLTEDETKPKVTFLTQLLT